MTYQVAPVPRLDGLWTFDVEVDGAAGVIVLVRGHVFGGDGAFYVTGNYSEHGDEIEADLTTVRFRPGPSSLAGGHEGGVIHARGHWDAATNRLPLAMPNGSLFAVLTQRLPLPPDLME